MQSSHINNHFVRFVYGSSGLEATYLNWRYDQPDDKYAWGAEDCVEVRAKFEDTWNDKKCADPDYFVCENGKHQITHLVFSNLMHSCFLEIPDVKTTVCDEGWTEIRGKCLSAGNFFLKNGKVSVSKDNPVKTFENYGPEFYVEFKIKFEGFDLGSQVWVNILRVTNGQNMGAHGNRFPAIFVKKGLSLFHFTTTVNEDDNYSFETEAVILHHDYHIVVSQQYNDQSQLIYKVVIDGKQIHSVVNTDGKHLDEATLYLSDPWFESIDDIGEMSDLIVSSGGEFFSG